MSKDGELVLVDARDAMAYVLVHRGADGKTEVELRSKIDKEWLIRILQSTVRQLEGGVYG